MSACPSDWKRLNIINQLFSAANVTAWNISSASTYKKLNNLGQNRNRVSEDFYSANLSETFTDKESPTLPSRQAVRLPSMNALNAVSFWPSVHLRCS